MAKNWIWFTCRAERLKYVFSSFWSDAGSGVHERNPDPSLCFYGSESNLPYLSTSDGLDRIGQEI
jgi:hypothetical protein